MADPIDLGAYREQRKHLAREARVGMDRYETALSELARSSAFVGWVLASPVRDADPILARGIYRLLLRRLQRQSDRALKNKPNEAAFKIHARSIIENAFRARLWEFEDTQRRADKGSAGGVQ